MKTYSLSELNAYLHRVITLNFEEPVWVRAEILQAKTHRGHTYLELIQKQEGQARVTAQASAVLWAKQRRQVEASLPNVDHFLREGSEVSLMVQVSYHPVYGLKLVVLNIDPAYTMGRLELERQRTIAQLKKEDLIGRNTALSLSPVIQRVAVISSEKASGYSDFIQHLRSNEYGYTFRVDLFQNAMQGPEVENQAITNLRKIQAASSYDCVVMIRGGGSRVDLQAFDSLNLSRHLAVMPIPVFTGIGHETDQAVADLVAHTSFKTPTAVAGFIIDRNLHYESTLLGHFRDIQDLAGRSIQRQRQVIQQLEQRVVHTSSWFLEKERLLIDQTYQQLRTAAQRLLEFESNLLASLAQNLRLLDPTQLLQRGFSYVLSGGKLVRSVRDLKVGDEMQTIFADGMTSSHVTKINEA